LHAELCEILVNEINTMPGFTPISMYAKLWAASGIDFEELIRRLIQLGMERFDERQNRRISMEEATLSTEGDV
jgi:D-alanine-D-alanine ligase